MHYPSIHQSDLGHASIIDLVLLTHGPWIFQRNATHAINQSVDIRRRSFVRSISTMERTMMFYLAFTIEKPLFFSFFLKKNKEKRKWNARRQKKTKTK